MRMIKGLLGGALVATLAASPALAADTMGPAAERFGWTGPYVGLTGGVTSGPFTFSTFAGGVLLGTVSVNGSGAFGGLQAGYDWQFGNFVVGGVADIALTGHQVDYTATFGLPAGTTAFTRLNYLGTARLRGGYAMDRALIYAHGGIAYGSTTFGGTGPGAFSITTGRFGWTAGAGAEFKITERISIGAEYGYVDLGQPIFVSGGGIDVREHVRFHSGKATINWRF